MHTIPSPAEELARLIDRAARDDERREPGAYDPNARDIASQREALKAYEDGVPLTEADNVHERIRLHGRKPMGTPIAVIWDSWRNRHRLLVSGGKCVACGRPTGMFTDGENDPRGALGDYAASPMDAHDDWPGGHDESYEQGELMLPACFNCENDEPRYRQLQREMAAAAKEQPSRASTVEEFTDGGYELVPGAQHDPDGQALSAWLNVKRETTEEEQ